MPLLCFLPHSMMKIKTVEIVIYISTFVLVFLHNGAMGHDVLISEEPKEFVSSFWKNWCLHLEFSMMTIEDPDSKLQTFKSTIEKKHACSN